MKNILPLYLSFLLLPFSLFADGGVSNSVAFALSPGDRLSVFGPNGAKLSEMPQGTVGQSISLPTGSFLASFGRDANSALTLIIAPNPEKPISLKFMTCGRTVEMDDKAFVTITYSNDGRSASIDPGYIGNVKIDGGSTSTPLVTAIPPSSPAPSPAPAPAPTLEPIVPTPSESHSATTSKNSGGAAHLPPGNYYWAEPVTPPGGKPPECTPNEMKLVELNGDVLVKPEDATEFKKAEEGQKISAGDTVKTGDGSSAAVFIGGVDSVRLTSQTEAAVDHQLADSKRNTTVNLKQGTVFAKIGRREGETQDFKVKTPYGVAAAKGTELAVSMSNGMMIVFTTKGDVVVTDASGQAVAKAHVDSGTGKIIVTPVPASATFTKDQEEQAIENILEAAKAVNRKVNAVLAKKSGDRSPEENAYLSLVLTIGFQPEGGGGVKTNFENPFGPLLNPDDVKKDLLLQLGPGDIPGGSGTGTLRFPSTTPV